MISDVVPTSLPLIKSWLGATTRTSATCGCETDTRFALSARRNTIDLLTVTVIVGADLRLRRLLPVAADANKKNTAPTQFYLAAPGLNNCSS